MSGKPLILLLFIKLKNINCTFIFFKVDFSSRLKNTRFDLLYVLNTELIMSHKSKSLQILIPTFVIVGVLIFIKHNYLVNKNIKVYYP